MLSSRTAIWPASDIPTSKRVTQLFKSSPSQWLTDLTSRGGRSKSKDESSRCSASTETWWICVTKYLTSRTRVWTLSTSTIFATQSTFRRTQKKNSSPLKRVSTSASSLIWKWVKVQIRTKTKASCLTASMTTSVHWRSRKRIRLS